MNVIEVSKQDYAKLIAEMGEERWFVYSLLRCLADERDFVTLTQAQLSTYLGVTARASISRKMKRMLEYRYKGYPVVRLEQEGIGGSPHIYRVMIDLRAESNPFTTSHKGDTLLYIDQDHSKEDNRESPNLDALQNARDVIAFWCVEYKRRYERDYHIGNWSREATLAKRLLNKHGSAKLKAMIRAVMTHYDTVWRNPKFPRPTLGMIQSWLGKQVEEYISEEDIITEMNPQLDDESVDLLKEFKEKGLL